MLVLVEAAFTHYCVCLLQYRCCFITPPLLPGLHRQQPFPIIVRPRLWHAVSLIAAMPNLPGSFSPWTAMLTIINAITWHRGHLLNKIDSIRLNLKFAVQIPNANLELPAFLHWCLSSAAANHISHRLFLLVLINISSQPYFHQASAHQA